MQVKITPSPLAGTVQLPPSKSFAIRALICSALSGGGSVAPLGTSADIAATVQALADLAAGRDEIFCNESGSLVRFLIPVAAALGKSVTFTGAGRLPRRPLDAFSTLLPQHGVQVQTDGGLPFSITGKLRPGQYEIAGNVSSQYLTGLLLALPLLDGDSAVLLTTELESKPYIDITLQVMAAFGVQVRPTDFGYLVRGNQQYKPVDFTVESDWSHAAFFMAAGTVGQEIEIAGLNPASTQGDKAVCAMMERFGARVEVHDRIVRCCGGELRSAEIDARDIPDMVPALAVTAAFAKGTTRITGAGRLRFKESDRLQSVALNLRAMGVQVEELPDGLVIHGTGAVQGGTVDGCNDHRIVMAFSVAAAYAAGDSVIKQAESINKTYPAFFEDFCALGGKADVISNR